MMATKGLVEAYRKRLAKITQADQLTAECLFAVATVKVVDYEEPVTGTLIAFQHYIAEGLFGPAVFTKVKLCFECVDEPGTNDCATERDLDWLTVSWLESVHRNGDGRAES